MFTHWSFILTLRFRQLGRIVKDGGLSLWLLLPVIFFFLVVMVVRAANWHATYYNAILVVLVLLADWQRPDRKFLLLLPKNGYWLRFTEYALLLGLANVYAMVLDAANCLYLLAALAILTIGLLFTSGKLKGKFRLQLSKRLTRLLPLELYDIKSGMRQIFLLLIVFWLVSLIVCWYLPAISFVVTAFICLLLESMIQAEPLAIIQSHKSLRHAVHRKIGINVSFLLVLLLPHILVAIWRFPDAINLLSLAVWMLCATFAYSVLLKYSGEQMAGSSVLSFIKIILFLVVSPLVPLTVYLIYREYQHALCRLKPLLN